MKLAIKIALLEELNACCFKIKAMRETFTRDDVAVVVMEAIEQLAFNITIVEPEEVRPLLVESFSWGLSEEPME